MILNHQKILIEHALFGYKDGHNLLFSSVPLATSVRQFLANVTDSSGPDNVKGFDVSLTGLPVPETNYYAIFATWPAPEMSRPGCVWSHVLLLQLVDLAHLPTMGQIRNLLVRPVLPISPDFYDNAIEFQWLPESSASQKLDYDRVLKIVHCLYDAPDRGVVILDAESKSWEKPVLDIWSQQWPRLRRDFAFSVGSLGDRRLTGISFDLQIAPSNSRRLWRSDAKTIVVDFDLSNGLRDADMPTWVNLVYDDLRFGIGGNFRSFLFRYASDALKPRAAVKQLAGIYAGIEEETQIDWRALLGEVGRCFPASNDVVRLKTYLLTTPPDYFTAAADEGGKDFDIACFMLLDVEASAFSKIEWDFFPGLERMWRERRNGLIALMAQLARRPESPNGRRFIKAVLEFVSSEYLAELAEANAEIVPMIIGYRYDLAFDYKTWLLPAFVQSHILERLGRLSMSSLEWGRVLGAMLTAAASISVRDVIVHAGDNVMVGAFGWLDSSISNELLPSEAWRIALAPYALNVLKEGDGLSPAELVFCAWCAPSDKVTKNVVAEHESVQRLVEQGIEAVPRPLRQTASFLMVSVGLRGESLICERMIAMGFFTVYESLASGKYPYECWGMLAPELPDLGWWNDWDRCKKLRKAVRKWHKKNGSHTNFLAEVASSNEQRELAHRVI